MVGEPVQQRSGEALRTEDLGPLVERQVGGDQDGVPLRWGTEGTKPSSSMISRFIRESCRCRLSRRLSSRASSGPLYLVFTDATPQRRPPAGVLRRHGAAGPPGLPHGRGVRRSGPGQPQPAVLAGNSPHSSRWLETPPFVAEGVAGKPGLFLPGRTVYFCPFQPGV